MILRKPYAILIKYFRLIHIVMFIFFGYFVFVLRKIYMFFAEYIKTNNFTYFENMVIDYVPTIVFIMSGVLLIFGIFIFLLMNKKEKPVLFYKVLIGYSVLLLIVFVYFFFFFRSLENTVYEPLRVVVNRDIILFVYIVNFFFVAITFIRGFGFDIKKFSFDKDKRELNLEESDSEEYELNVKIEKEDIKNYLHRQKREFRYYFKQNAAFFIIITVIAVVSVGLYVYYDNFVVNRIYNEGESVDFTSKVYKVNSSHITDKDKFGREISKDNDFLIIDLNVVNNSKTGYLDQQALRVNINDEYYYPHSTSCDLFSDVGNCYDNQELKEKSSNDFIVVYKIKKGYDKIYLEILKSKGDNYHYNKVLLTYKNYEIENLDYKINDSININNTDVKITKYETVNKANYQYEECISGKCNKYIKNVLPSTGEIVLALEMENLDKLSDDFLNSAVGIEYGNNKIYGKDLKMIDRHDNMVYYSVPTIVKNMDSFKLIITMRTRTYNILLEGGNNE